MKTLMIKSDRQTDERGFASIVIALTLVLILALLTVGFAQLTRREQRSALNKQLATQAYYAAESGIEDVAADIKSGQITTNNTGCTPTIADMTKPYYSKPTSPLSNQLAVGYTCLSVNLDPTVLEYSNFGDGSYHTITFSSAAAAVDTLKVSWTSTTTGKTATGGVIGGLKQKSAWNDPALMEVSITPLNNLTRAALVNGNFTVYGYPINGGSLDNAPYGFSTSPQEGTIHAANCIGSTCSFTITGLSGSGAGVGPYLLHLTDHYDQSNVKVTGTDINGVALKFHGAQAVIDSTGRARGVLKRLQVHVPLTDSPLLPNYAIEATEVCKRIATTPSSDTFVQPNGSTATNNTQSCFLN
jgi:Tfp pilus assembly protein PilX